MECIESASIFLVLASGHTKFANVKQLCIPQGLSARSYFELMMIFPSNVKQGRVPCWKTTTWSEASPKKLFSLKKLVVGSTVLADVMM